MSSNRSRVTISDYYRDLFDDAHLCVGEVVLESNHHLLEYQLWAGASAISFFFNQDISLDEAIQLIRLGKQDANPWYIVISVFGNVPNQFDEHPLIYLASNIDYEKVRQDLSSYWPTLWFKVNYLGYSLEKKFSFSLNRYPPVLFPNFVMTLENSHFPDNFLGQTIATYSKLKDLESVKDILEEIKKKIGPPA